MGKNRGMRPGPTQYTTVGDAMVAYQVTGEGPIDLVYMIGVGSNFEMWWDYPPYARMLERFASYSRLILFDRRGSGISDPLPSGQLPTWEHFTEDLGAVLDAAGSDRAAVFAAFDSGGIALVFAATNPQRVSSLVLWNSYARNQWAEDYPIGIPAEAEEAMNESIIQIWGTEDLSRYLMPDVADDEETIRWNARLLRGAATPASFARQNKQVSGMDARPSLPLIQAPVLVMNTTGHTMVAPALGRYVAERVTNGRFVEIPGKALDMFSTPNREELEDLVQEFVTGRKPRAMSDRVLASVLFTDIVGSTETLARVGDARWKAFLEEHDRAAGAVIDAWAGRLVQTTGDGVLAVFDGPGRAIRCALEMGEALRRHDIRIRSGVHFGEIEQRSEGNVGGLAVHVAARTMALAGADEILCTRTVKELSLGSGLEFEDRGTHMLKGVPETWQMYAVRTN